MKKSNDDVKASSTNDEYQIDELIKDTQLFIKRLNALDKIKDAEVKQVLEPMMINTGVAKIMQLLMKYFDVDMKIVDKINMKGQGIPR